jgi:cytochrome c553
MAVVALTAMSSVYASETVSYSDLGDLENGKKIFEEGKQIVQHPDTGDESVSTQVGEAQAGIEVPACTTCHGQNGEGSDPMGTPRLAGQGFNFLVKQLEDFASEKRMDTTMFVMNNNAKGLNEQERRDVAAYVASLGGGAKGSDMEEVKSLGMTPVGVRYLGKSLAQYGAPDRGIPACHSCHGYNGRGAYPVYPRLSGQKYTYLVNQLKKWRDGSRANDPLAQMRNVAKKMTDEDIYNVSAFLTNAPLTTQGNARIPEQK